MQQLSSYLRSLLLTPALVALVSAAQAQLAAFGPVTTYSTGTDGQPNGIVVADVNGDNRFDLLTVNSSNATVGVLIGTGAGGFSSVTQYSTGNVSYPRGIAVADVNGDGRLDLEAIPIG